jgi:thioredoxin-related protein
MRKINLLLLLSCLFVTVARSQNSPPPQAPEKAYMKDAGIPSFPILEMDSVTIFNTAHIPKGKKTAILFFSPSCSHCLNFIKSLLANMDSVKKVQFYMITAVHDMDMIRSFYKEYDIKKYKNIKLVGRDKDFFFITHYGLVHFPGVALYDEKKKFVHFMEGEITVSDIYKYVH